MKRSIRKQFSLIFIALVAGIICLSCLANTFFLEKYYVRKKVGILMDAYQSIVTLSFADDQGQEAFADELSSICSRSNIAMFILDANSQTRYASTNGGKGLEYELLGYLFGMEKPAEKVLEQTEDYILQQKSLRDGEYLRMQGTLANGISFILSTPLESIRESAGIANRFSLYVGLLGAVLGGIAIWLIAGKITRPIKQLNLISEQMVELDFEAKYQGRDRNEIGMLGENMNKLSASLEKTIGELKTANLTLTHDLQTKERQEQMRQEFIAGVSHELKTPIALIQGYAEGLSEGIADDDPESKAFYCEVIMDEAAKMNSIVSKLLTLNELEFGSSNPEMKRFDLTEFVSQYLASAAMLAQQKDIRVEFDDSHPVFIWGDEERIAQVIENYFSNAVNHCKGEKKIHISVTEEGEHVRCAVFNTGDPIPEDSLPHLWDKFYKVDKARSREYGGSGVGLSIVKAIVESMNGTYGVRNVTGGVEFWFEL